MENLIKIFNMGGISLYPLLICSVIMISVIIENILISIRTNKPVEPFLSEDAPEDNKTPYGRLIGVYNLHFQKDKDVLKSILDAQSAIEGKSLVKNISSLATIGVISPFIGLFGTVLGIIKAFENIAKTGKMGAAVVSAGVAEALIATAAGLFVAIIAVTAYNFFKAKADEVQDNLDILCLHLYAKSQIKKDS